MTQVASRGAARRKRHDRIRAHAWRAPSAAATARLPQPAATSTRRSSTTARARRSPPRRPSRQALRRLPSGTKTDEAAAVGAPIAERAKAAGISTVVFDRGGYRYHGRVKALADAAREAGLEF